MKNFGIILGVLGWANLGFVGFPVSEVMAAGTTGLPVTGWYVVGAKDQKFGPKEEAGKIIFGGEGFGAKGRNLAAFFPATEIGEGLTLRMKANVRFTGVAGTGNFRYGLFKKRSKDHSRGWLGYCAYAGFDKAFPSGALLARLAENDADFSGMKDAKGQEAARNLGASVTGVKTIKDGLYVVVLSLKKTGGAIEIESSMDGAGDVPTPMVRYSVKDNEPVTSTFDALGFVTHEVLSVDSIEFSNVSLDLIVP